MRKNDERLKHKISTVFVSRPAVSLPFQNPFIPFSLCLHSLSFHCIPLPIVATSSSRNSGFCLFLILFLPYPSSLLLPPRNRYLTPYHSFRSGWWWNRRREKKDKVKIMSIGPFRYRPSMSYSLYFTPLRSSSFTPHFIRAYGHYPSLRIK